MKDQQSLCVNILPVEISDTIITCNYYREKASDRVPLRKFEFDAIQGEESIPDDIEQLYTDFKSKEDENVYLSLTVDIDKTRLFFKHYVHHQLLRRARYLDPQPVRSRNFVNSVQLLFRYRAGDERSGGGGAGYLAYRVFNLTCHHTWFSEGPGLAVTYKGLRFKYEYPVSGDRKSIDTNLLNNVILENESGGGWQFKYRDIPEDKWAAIDFMRLYPVVNYDIRAAEKRFSIPNPQKEKVREYYESIEWFRSTIASKLSDEQLSIDTEKWCQLNNKQYSSIPTVKGELRFRNNQVELNPYNGLSSHGPLHPPPPPVKNYKLYFAAHRDDISVVNELKVHFSGKHRASAQLNGINRFLNLPVDFNTEPLLFQSLHEAHNELHRALIERGIPAQDEQVAVVYVSPIDKEDSSEKNREVYYRLKEMFLRKGIPVQVIEKSTIQNSRSFRYSLPNIYSAIHAKLGGIPWKLNDEPENELLVGVGAFKGQNYSKAYIGSAFCFESDGTMSGLRCFAKDEPKMLAGSIREAIELYVSRHSSAERLIIHFFKTMSYRERKPILDMMKQLHLSIPLVVLTINKTEFEDIILIDENNAAKLPLSGTWVKRNKRDILLCNNTRYFTNSKKIRSHPYPLRIQLWASEKEMLDDMELSRHIVTQVYQFSRLYWKSVSQQSLPVTIAYPELVARIFPHFDATTLPTEGRDSLWFL